MQYRCQDKQYGLDRKTRVVETFWRRGEHGESQKAAAEAGSTPSTRQ